MDGKRCLLKGGSAPSYQEPYNEVIASLMMRRLGIPHVPYQVILQEEFPYSVCEDFVASDTELVSAWYIMQTEKKANHVTVYQHYLNCCEHLGIPDVRQSLDQMMVLDYLIANEDRHQNNFGVLRNAETLEWLGAAPIYDSGSSLWFECPVESIRSSRKITCKPFKTTHEEQIRLVSSFDWLELSALDGVEEEIREILRDAPYISETRCDLLCRMVRKRIKSLEEVMEGQTTVLAIGTEGEVKEDVAYSGRS